MMYLRRSGGPDENLQIETCIPKDDVGEVAERGFRLRAPRAAGDRALDDDTRGTPGRDGRDVRTGGAPDRDARLFGTARQRRRWLKAHYTTVPGRYALWFLYHWLVLGAWRAGPAGWRWAWLRCFVYRLRE